MASERIRPAGLEPATDGLENRCSIQLSYERDVENLGFGDAPGRVRTCGLRFRKPPLYPTELRAPGLISYLVRRTLLLSTRSILENQHSILGILHLGPLFRENHRW